LYVGAMILVICGSLRLISRTPAGFPKEVLPTQTNERSSPSAAVLSKRTEENREQGVPQLGKLVQVGDVAYTINDVKWKTVLGEGESECIAEKTGFFLDLKRSP
jgi:hypothetical protein